MDKRMKVKAGALLLALVMAAMVCGGCLSPRSPDEYGYALVVGIDAGEEKQFYISMLLQRDNGSAESGDDLCPLTGVECDDLFEGITLIESGLPFTLNFSRTTAMVFNHKIAASGKLEDFLSVSLGTLQIRYYANLIVSYGRAEDFLKGIQSELNPNVAKLQYSFVEYGEETGLVPSVTLAQFYDRAWSGAGDVLVPLGALIEPVEAGADNTASHMTDLLGATEYLPASIGREGGLKSGVIGSAIFRGKELAGFLNGHHTQAVLIATGQFETGRIQLRIDDRIVSVTLKKSGAPKTYLRLGEKPYAQIHLKLEATIERPAITASMEEEVLKAQISAHIATQLKEVFNACRDVDADAFSLGKEAVQQFTSTDSWEAYDWPANYRRTDADFFVDVALSYNPTKSRLE